MHTWGTTRTVTVWLPSVIPESGRGSRGTQDPGVPAPLFVPVLGDGIKLIIYSCLLNTVEVPQARIPQHGTETPEETETKDQEYAAEIVPLLNHPKFLCKCDSVNFNPFR